MPGNIDGLCTDGLQARSFKWWNGPTSFFNGEKPPPAGDAFEDMRTSIQALDS
jgi:hypothetical protein